MDPGIEARHQKQLGKMGVLLNQHRYLKALKAMSHIEALEAGEFRKDGKTPKLHHQLSVARLTFTLVPHLLHPDETLAVCFLHDIMEDYGTDTSELTHTYGSLTASAIWKLTKKYGTVVKPYEEYFTELALCPIGSVVKLADRAHNIQTMQGVFGSAKQRTYVEEVSTWFFPLIREARRRHPSQYDAYENLKILLRCQVSLLRQVLGEAP